MNKINTGAVVLFSVGFATFVVLNVFWSDICVSLDCSAYTMDAYLAPLREAGLVLATISLPFVFLPFHYFKSWILYLLPLMFLITLAAISNIDPNSGNMFNATREEAMNDFVFQWGIATLVFVLYCWQQKHGGKKVGSGKYLLVALGAILIAFAFEVIRVGIGMQFGVWW